MYFQRPYTSNFFVRFCKWISIRLYLLYHVDILFSLIKKCILILFYLLKPKDVIMYLKEIPPIGRSIFGFSLYTTFCIPNLNFLSFCCCCWNGNGLFFTHTDQSLKNLIFGVREHQDIAKSEFQKFETITMLFFLSFARVKESK